MVDRPFDCRRSRVGSGIRKYFRARYAMDARGAKCDLSHSKRNTTLPINRVCYSELLPSLVCKSVGPRSMIFASCEAPHPAFNYIILFLSPFWSPTCVCMCVCVPSRGAPLLFVFRSCEKQDKRVVQTQPTKLSLARVAQGCEARASTERVAWEGMWGCKGWKKERTWWWFYPCLTRRFSGCTIR